MSSQQAHGSALMVRAFFARGWNRAWTVAESECRDLTKWDRVTKRTIIANLEFKIQAMVEAGQLKRTDK